MSSKPSPAGPRAYAEAGVDITAGSSLVKRIKGIVGKTFSHNVLSDIGGFGGLFRLDSENYTKPVLVAGADGVGTKLKLAILFNQHRTIGIDLVAMSVNDILVQGAKPLFFLDYFATGNLDVDQAEMVITGIAEGCLQAGCSLLGGETAEMPDMYQDGDYDLAGFCVGIVDNAKIIDGSSIKAGDAIIGLASSGPHSNGYSLIRKLLAQSGLAGNDPFPGTDRLVKDVLLEPTIIYTDHVKNLMRDIPIGGMVHITGGGFYENIPRTLPPNLRAIIEFASWDIPPVFYWLAETGKISWPEMLQIFNCGIGYVVVVREEYAEEVVNRLAAMNMPAWKIGMVDSCPKTDPDQILINF